MPVNYSTQFCSLIFIAILLYLFNQDKYVLKIYLLMFRHTGFLLILFKWYEIYLLMFRHTGFLLILFKWYVSTVQDANKTSVDVCQLQ